MMWSCEQLHVNLNQDSDIIPLLRVWKKSADKWIPRIPSWGALVAARMVSFGLLPEQPIFWNATGRPATFVVTLLQRVCNLKQGWQREYTQLKRSPLGCPRLLQRSFLWHLATLQVGSCPSVHLLAPAPLFRRVGLQLPQENAADWLLDGSLLGGRCLDYEQCSMLSLLGWPLLAILHRLQEAFVREASAHQDSNNHSRWRSSTCHVPLLVIPLHLWQALCRDVEKRLPLSVVFLFFFRRRWCIVPWDIHSCLGMPMPFRV